MKKKALAVGLCFVLLFSFMDAIVLATGDVNMDSTSGGGYSGSRPGGETVWSGGSGVRLSIMDAVSMIAVGPGLDYTYATPPDPKADDQRPVSFNISAPMPSNAQMTSASWGVWRADLDSVVIKRPIEVLVAVTDPNGVTTLKKELVDFLVTLYFYVFSLDSYSATLSATCAVSPDAKVPTARGDSISGYSMKSGYGFNNTVEAQVAGSAPSDHVSLAQTAVSWFPEFNYASFSKVLDLTMRNGANTKLEFKNNKYSTYNRRVHYTPLWYPDAPYKVYTWLYDAWTPAGMLSINLSSGLDIDGVLFEDWHIAPIK